jgi:HPt (histidine-containing phosphotransfer) domain-containing protein
VEVVAMSTSHEDQAAPAPEQVFDPRAVLERLAGDMELLRELVEMFETDGPEVLERIRAAVAAGNAKDLHVAAHTLKGTASNFCAAEATAAAQRLETLGKNGDLTGTAGAFRTLDESMRRLMAALRKWKAEG